MKTMRKLLREESLAQSVSLRMQQFVTHLHCSPNPPCPALSVTTLFFFFLFSGFSGFIPQVPIQVLAVTGSAAGASVVFHSHVAASLLADGTNLASKLFAKFQTTSSQFQHQGLFLFDCDVT